MKLFGKISLAVLGTVVGVALLLVIAATCVIYSASARTRILEKGVEIANEQTDYDIDLGRLYLSPFHHSPMVLYRAWKGEQDLPLGIDIDSLYVGHRGQDTLAYVHGLRLRATLMTTARTEDLLAMPIVVEQLHLDTTTIHTDSLIEALGLDVQLRALDLTSPELIVAKGQYPLHDLRAQDMFVGVDLRSSSDTTETDTVSEPMLMCFDVPNGELRNIRFLLTPMGLDLGAESLTAQLTADVGNNLYDVRRIDIGTATFAMGDLMVPVDTLYGDARVDLDNNLITSGGLHARSDAMGAKADLSATEMNLETMRVDVVADADFKGSMASLRGFYDIDDEAYDMQVRVDRVDLSPFLQDKKHVVLAGDIAAVGKGIDPNSAAMKSKLNLHLRDAVYDNIDVSGVRLEAELARRTVTGTLHLPVAMADSALSVKAMTEHQFEVAEFMTPERMRVDYHADMRHVQAHVAGEDFRMDALTLDFATDTATSVDLRTKGLSLSANSPMHVLTLVDRVQPLLDKVGDSTVIQSIVSLSDLSMLDTLRHLIPDLAANVSLRKGSPVQPMIDRMGLDIDEVKLSLASDSTETALALAASIPDIEHPEDSTALRLPAVKAKAAVTLSEGATRASLEAKTRLTDGAMTLHGLKSDANLKFDLTRREQEIRGNGRLSLNDLSFGDMVLGNRTVDMAVSPSTRYANSIKADVRLDDIPMELVDSILKMPDLDLEGAVRATASADGLPANMDLSAQVFPLNISALYKPYDVKLSLGETPIVMEHNQVDFNGLPIYGADSTYLALTGGLNIDSMMLDVVLRADSFVPTHLVKDGPIPVYGNLATDIRGRVSGSLDSILADVDVTILPSTDITYPIDKKNLAQVKPHGTVNVQYGVADNSLNLGGQVRVDDGVIRYSPKMYPVMPFRVDSGSIITFHGPIGQTRLDISASQQVKADVEPRGETLRRVAFNTGVRVRGVVDSIGIRTVGFFLDAPKDETVSRELAATDEDTREGLAAVLLATGMYVGDNNLAAQREGYALSSIVNSRINAALANSKMGKKVDIDISSGKQNDMNISVSKSMFNDKLRVTVGSTISDKPDVNDTKGLLRSITADYKLTKDGDLLLRLFSQRDENNVLEGELNKSGIGVLATKEWQRQEYLRKTMDSITRTYGLSADVALAYRSNNSLGPDMTLKSSIKNLLGHGETFTLKGNGAYYWALRNRHPGDPKKTDTYKLGANASLIFPYLHWVGDNNPDGDTRYMLGYQYENIAGGYGVHKVTGSFTYFIRSSKYITHAFTPFSLSVVRMKAESDSLLDKAAEYPKLIQVLAGDEFVPAIGYTFTYNDYRAKRAVNTMFDFGVKESGNLINAIYCLFGHKWSEQDKPLGSITFNQFVKVNTELRNKFNLTDKVAIATRIFAGANIPLGNSTFAPLSESFYAGGPNSLRAATPYAYGPGNFYSAKYNQNFFHAGDVKLEGNFELRFPIVWKLYGAAFLDAGNVWNWYSTVDVLKESGFEDYIKKLQLPEDMKDGLYNNPDIARQIALGTGAGLRLDLDGLVVRLDIGVGIHAPYQTFKYNTDKNSPDYGKPDPNQPIHTYFNMPSAMDAIRVNFGIGYPF